MEKLRLMLIDKNMNAVEFEINKLQFRSLHLDLSKIKGHERKRDLNKTITDFIESFEEKNEKNI